MNLAHFPFPKVNASLNGASAILLICGYLLIRNRRIRSHATCMIAALCTSTLFLASYITYHVYHYIHSNIGVTRFPPGPWRPCYLAILLSHTLLALVTVPLVVVTVVRAWRRQWDKHRRIARWTFPIWLYVSVTGVLIYLMLYQMPHP